MRTQNPPPLKACRFDSDLGHHVNQSYAAVAISSRLLLNPSLILVGRAFFQRGSVDHTRIERHP
jgi:hypothetical protein